jgi:hypothetical protein
LRENKQLEELESPAKDNNKYFDDIVDNLDQEDERTSAKT